MLTRIEETIVKDILAKTDDPNLATLALVLRDIIPKLEMNGVPLTNIIAQRHFEVERIDRELSPDRY